MEGTHRPPTAPQGDGAKRARLDGGALTEETVASSAAVLRRGARHKGLQQYFSPPEAAQLAARVMGGDTPYGPAVLDPTAGDGALLAGWPPQRRFGVEIDSDQIKAGDYTAVHGDLQRVYPLLRLAGVRVGAVVCNPPFGLDWHDATTDQQANSTLLCLRFALGLLDDHGQGLLIAGRERFARELAGRPEAHGVYATVDCDDLFDGVALPCVLAFFVAPAQRTTRAALAVQAPRAQLGDLADEVIAAREQRASRVSGFCAPDEIDRVRGALTTVGREHDRRRAARTRRQRHDVELRGERIACHPSAFAKLALAERGQLRAIEGLDGKSIRYFGLNLRDWRALSEAGQDGALTLAPGFAAAVERAVGDAVREATPMYAVRPQMRLGFVADVDRLRCRRDDPTRGFLAGERYPLRSRTKVDHEHGQKTVETKHGPELCDYRQERKLLELTVGEHVFNESPEDIAYLIEHFEIPDPGDVGSRYPEQVQRARTMLDQIAERRQFTWRRFQREDLARLLVKGSGVLGHEQGLGKTLQQLAFAEAAPRLHGSQHCALFVVPQDLIPQWQREAQRFFGRTLEPIGDQGAAKRVAARLRRGGGGWFVTWYEALSLRGRRDEALPVVSVLRDGERRADVPADNAAPLTSLEVCPACREPAGEHYRDGICRACGHVHRRLRVPTVASLLSTAFGRGVICVDELSMIRGEGSLRSHAIRGLRARHPLGATGTPIANYVDDLFPGFWWALGNASARWPYDYHGRAKFQADHCVIETQTHERDDGTVTQRRKVLPEVTNLSVLWRLLSGGMVRRRMEDTGEDLVELRYHPTRVPFGQRQLELHERWLKDFERFFTQTHPDSPLVKAGVVHLFCAAVGQLPKLEYAATLPQSDPDLEWTQIAASNWTPKTLKALELCLERVRAGDKVLIGSCLVETGRFLAHHLCQRGVRAVHIVEERQGRAQTKNPAKRADAIRAFIDGDAQVLCAGVQAVKLGHNLDTASSVILTGLPWSFEALDQFIKRVRRLTSRRPVSVYPLLTRGSLDERKWDLLDKKGAASDVALDGQLMARAEEQVDWNRVLREMRAAGVSASGDELDERDLAALWQRAEGPYRPLGPPAEAELGLAQRLASPHADEPAVAPDDDGQLALDLAA
ncbi:MAG: SNF2-related protein [Solirubrobacteraceae bacterium MAG38_C4-C5]|nr:SNF2-related protein [Candidatus Siliceabacter maunaloa]